uniref:Retinol binding protein 5 n=1 Tax=Myotis myotis TaxID=51298 RepID=A0A7J7Z803_MYOMY|nr:retinol binding protein 5 [Myotis myotis]
MPPNLTGYYCFVSQKNMEDYLQALNINMALRKIALLLKPDKEIDHQGNHMTVKTLSTFRNYVLEFEVPNRGWRHWLEGEMLHLELTARDAVCKQVFRKVK